VRIYRSTLKEKRKNI